MKAGAESSLYAPILQALHLHGVFAWRTNNTAIYDPVAKRFRGFQGLKGVSDIIGVIPGAGKFLGIEAKTESGRISKDQRAFLARVNEAGGVGRVVRSLDDVLALLEELGIRRRA